MLFTPARARHITAIEIIVKKALRLYSHVKLIKKLNIIIEMPIANATAYKIEFIKSLLFIVM